MHAVTRLIHRLLPLPLFLVLCALAGLAVWPLGSVARESVGAAQSESISLSELPPEAVRTLELIRRGGPFPFAKDGTVFGNRERHLPRQPRGHYTEYTVKTPGTRSRGARRIIAGGDATSASAEFWYTEDHYRSFRRIRE